MCASVGGGEEVVLSGEGGAFVAQDVHVGCCRLGDSTDDALEGGLGCVSAVWVWCVVFWLNCICLDCGVLEIVFLLGVFVALV